MHQPEFDAEGTAMSLPADARIRMEHLIAGFMDGALNSAEEQEFAGLLAHNEARQAYYAQTAVHVMLNLEHERSRVVSFTPPETRPWNWSRIVPLASAALVLFTLGAVIAYRLANPSTPFDGRMLQPEQFASLIMADNAVWNDAETPGAVGARMGKKTLRLKSGSVAIAFDNGAQVVIKGPATFELEQPSETSLQSGSALISAAKDTKFSVRNHATLCSYRDGAFGMTATEKGDGEVHAVGGSVEIKTPNQQQILAAGTSVAFDSRGLRGEAASSQNQDFKELLALLKNIAAGNKAIVQAGGNNILIGWDFRETIWHLPGGDRTVTPTQNHPANASHDVPGVRGTFYHTASGQDSGAHDNSWTTSVMNSVDHFAYITLLVQAPSVTLTGLQSSIAANDSAPYSVNVEISARDAKGPIGENFTVLGSFTPRREAQPFSIFSGAMTLKAGTYYIRFRPTTTPRVSTSWMWFEYVVLKGAAHYTDAIPNTDF
jgi:ferric-dicitrate binding protein FerR (iron transport regulator)